MVAAPWRRFFQAARWNGYAAHRTTGEARVNMSHCQFVNWNVLIIEISSTGMPRVAATMSRLRSASSSGSAASSSSSAASSTAGSRTVGSLAV